MSTRTEPISSPSASVTTGVPPGAAVTTGSPPAAPSSGTPSPGAAEPSLVGKRVHKYEVVRVIGRGGMGTVYEGLNTAIGKRVAMKFIDAAAGSNADAVARFQREAQAASAVESAHIVEIFDSGLSEEGQPFIVMELLRGEDLGHRIKRCGRLELGEAMHVTAQILRGLYRAHKAGIVHRDLKPDNIFLVDRDDDPSFAKILDFGISKVRRQGDTPVNTLTRQGTVLGTPFYMSPEQAQAQPDVDARSDLWSVGAILFECLTGRPPYSGGSYEQVIVNICMKDADDVRVYNPAVPEPIAAVIARALSRERDDRFADAREFLDTLRSGAGGLISSRGGMASDDSFPGAHSSDPPLLPISSGRTPSGEKRKGPGSDDPALDATLQFRSTPPDEPRSSLAARKQKAAASQRRLFVLVALSALTAGGLGAFVVARTWIKPARVTTGVPSASADPVAPPEAVLVGTTTAQAPPPPEPATAQPVIVPAPETAIPDPGKAPKVVRGTPPPPPPPVSVSVKPPPKTVETAAPTGTGTGVAPGLKLKPP
jgi:eukaryotic-like serine/threonine-protein kinase